MAEKTIIGINITDRVQEANKIQEILTKYGCSIKTRLGLHEVVDNYCSKSGLILLELTGDKSEYSKLEQELLKVQGLEIKKMIFTQ